MGDGSEHGSGIWIRSPRVYEITSALAFRGRRRKVYDELIAAIAPPPGGHVLDVGCGPGFLAKRLASVVGPAGRVEGIDPSQEVIDHARRRAAANTTFSVGDAQALPYEDQCFDYVFCTLVLHHLPREDRTQALREICRVLKPGGMVLIGDFRPRHGKRDGGSSPGSNDAEVSALLAGAGLQVIRLGDSGHGIRYFTALRP
jgi:ubiquinone/menaquinone biosynthesis C-methylase UbiE